MAHPTIRDLLYTNGYIARGLGALDAPLYFARLLRMEDEHFLQPTFSPAWPNAFFITNPTVLNSPPTIFIGNHPAWLLDYVVQNGTVIPQRIWSPGTPSDAQRYNNVTLKMPIFFIHSDLRTLGLRLLHAAAGDCPGLLNARSRAPVGDCHTTSIRIKWPGYAEWQTQIMTRDQTTAHNTINLETLAKRAARAVCKFLDFAARQQCQNPDWQVGDGGITQNDIVLIGLIHVSQGSWQPILQHTRYVFSGSSHVL